MLYHQEGPLKYQKWFRKNHETYPKNTPNHEALFFTTWLPPYFLKEGQFEFFFRKFGRKNREQKSRKLIKFENEKKNAENDRSIKFLA